MINVKLLVLLICIDVIQSSTEYCEICPKHTLCMYKNPGPSASCRSYDTTALLTKDDVQNIVSKINQRRNFVALGLARNLPSAANMNKMTYLALQEWSEELATFAQRWVDQCDVAVRPDSEDFCRDLVDTKVGQNIATVTGYSPGLNVKSFVEMWFIEALDYTGSVAYYNQSRGSKTNYFTQLIWAETRLVGCGKARFSIDDRGTMVDRLVCNFAPRGNVQGKPVYTIGYPATQCKENDEGDEIFTGLCRPITIKLPESTSAPAVSSLLRVLSPQNYSLKQDIDPVRNNIKNEGSGHDVVMSVGHQKIRHVPNNTHVVMHHEIPLKVQNTHAVTNIPSRHDAIPYHHTLDYLENVHGAVYKARQSTENYRRHGFVRESARPCNSQNIRKYKSYGICTRHSGTGLPYCETSDQNKARIEQCTRGLKGNEYLLTTNPHYQKTIPTSHDICACNSQKTTCIPSTTQCTCNLNCQCLNLKNYEAGHRRQNPSEYAYYDFPELAIHGAEQIETRHLLKHTTDSAQTVTLAPAYTNNDENSDSEYLTLKKNTQDYRQLSFRRDFQSREYPYGVMNPRQRSKRQLEEQPTQKPFWEVHDYNNKQSQLKSLRYTTLPNYRRKKIRTPSPNKTRTEQTEPITIRVGDEPEHHHDATEKFLSFDELMHLRKINGLETGFNIRRGGGGEKSNDKSTTTTVPTVTTTLFKPLKHCSRKATCTWTAPTVTDIEGKVVDQGKRGQSGSRTPPGYVDGCTRTSTCTREFLNRNKQANATDDLGVSTPEDEDYCERRSLNLKRKDSYGTGTVKTRHQCETHTESPAQVTNSMIPENTEIEVGCSCDEQEIRSKRNIGFNHNKKQNPSRSQNNYDYHYSILGKILQTYEYSNRHKNNLLHKVSACLCNTSIKACMHKHNYLFIFLYFIFLHN